MDSNNVNATCRCFAAQHTNAESNELLFATQIRKLQTTSGGDTQGLALQCCTINSLINCFFPTSDDVSYIIQKSAFTVNFQRFCLCDVNFLCICLTIHQLIAIIPQEKRSSRRKLRLKLRVFKRKDHYGLSLRSPSAHSAASASVSAKRCGGCFFGYRSIAAVGSRIEYGRFCCVCV